MNDRGLVRCSQPAARPEMKVLTVPLTHVRPHSADSAAPSRLPPPPRSGCGPYNPHTPIRGTLPIARLDWQDKVNPHSLFRLGRPWNHRRRHRAWVG